MGAPQKSAMTELLTTRAQSAERKSAAKRVEAAGAPAREQGDAPQACVVLSVVGSCLMPHGRFFRAIWDPRQIVIHPKLHSGTLFTIH